MFTVFEIYHHRLTFLQEENVEFFLHSEPDKRDLVDLVMVLDGI